MTKQPLPTNYDQDRTEYSVNDRRGSVLNGTSTETYGLIERFANESGFEPILITGEPGVGKGLIARALHNNGEMRRLGRQFVPFYSREMSEAEYLRSLFGFEAEEDDGHIKKEDGYLHRAGNGVLYIEELCELPYNAQGRLLGVISDGRFTPESSFETENVEVKLILGTSKDVEKALGDNTLRRDLLYRINRFHIHMPPLRERGSDIVVLYKHFVQKYNAMYGKEVDAKPNRGTSRFLRRYKFPGNVRELENLVARAVFFADSNEISFEHLTETEN